MSGIHHVTAIAGEARRNLQFYTGVLGLRLVKRTVNFDDPGTHHLYFGDEAGTPGTILTFFPWANAAPRRGGTGEQEETSLRVPRAALDAWAERLQPFGAERVVRFGEPGLAFRDPDGLGLALIGADDAEQDAAWTRGGIPATEAVRGVHGARLHGSAKATAAVLTNVFGFEPDGTEQGVSRFRGTGSVGGIVDLRDGTGAPARQGRGSVHHLAFRARDDAEQADMAARLARDHDTHPTPQKDRDYFRSIYFRSPGGVLFEIATDGPGFAVDEPAAELGSALKLPRLLQGRRADIEAALSPLA